jgi:tetratricopeptide (TPR) repeat protein
MNPGDLLVARAGGTFRKVLHVSRFLNAVTEGLCLEFAPDEATGYMLTTVSLADMKGWRTPSDAAASEHLQRWVFDRKPDAEGRLIDAMASGIGDKVRSKLRGKTRRGFEIVHAILNAGNALHGILDVVLVDAASHVSIRRLNEAIDANPLYRLSHVLLGDIYLNEGRFVEAANIYESAVALPCASELISVSLLNNLGCAKVYLGRSSFRSDNASLAAEHFATAIQAFTAALMHREDDVEIQNNLAAAFLYHARSLAATAASPTDGLQHLLNALEQGLAFSRRFPTSDLCHLLQGSAFHCLADCTAAGAAGLDFSLEAKRHYEAVVGSTAMDGYLAALASYNMASLLIRSAQTQIVDPSTALHLLEQCARLLKTSKRPRTIDVDALMIRGYLALGRLDDARVLQGLVDSRETGIAVAAIRRHIEHEQYTAALQLSEVALDGHPADPELHYLAGKSLHALKRPDEAHRHFAAALTAHPARYWDLTSALAVHELRAKRVGEAIRWFELAFLAAPDDLTNEQLKRERNDVVGKYFESIFIPDSYALLQRHARAFLDCLMEAELDYFCARDFSRPFMAPFLLLVTAIETAVNTMLVGRILKELKLGGNRGHILPIVGRSVSLNHITMGSWKDLLRGAVGVGDGPQKASFDAVTLTRDFVSRLAKRKRTGQESYADYLRRRVSDKLIGGRSLEDLRNSVVHPDATTFQIITESDIHTIRREFLNVDSLGRRLDKSLPNFFEMLAEIYEVGA